MATSLRKKLYLAMLTFFLLAMGIPTQHFSAFAQSVHVGARQVKQRITPEYPELAKRMNLTGKVKIEVVISPSGQVVQTRGIGGHPVLLRAAEAAIKDWKFSPSTETTVGTIEIEFTGTVAN